MADLPEWLERVRREEIVRVFDARGYRGSYAFDTIRLEIVGGGQANFDEPWDPGDGRALVSPDERALLYAYCNQKGHLEELLEAFGMLFGESSFADSDPVVIDLGCGPFTGGLALASVLGPTARFSYVGVDTASSMRRLAESLARAAVAQGAMHDGERQWCSDLSEVVWVGPARWRPVLVIVSYLLASSTVDPVILANSVVKLLERIGRGRVTVLYTNSTTEVANRSLPQFQRGLEAHGFVRAADDVGSLDVGRFDGRRSRTVRYVLFHRQAQRELFLGED